MFPPSLNPFSRHNKATGDGRRELRSPISLSFTSGVGTNTARLQTSHAPPAGPNFSRPRRGTLPNLSTTGSTSPTDDNGSAPAPPAQGPEAATNQSRRSASVDLRCNGPGQAISTQQPLLKKILPLSLKSNKPNHKKSPSDSSPPSSACRTPVHTRKPLGIPQQANPRYPDFPPTPVRSIVSNSPKSSLTPALETNGSIEFNYSPQSNIGRDSLEDSVKIFTHPPNMFNTAAVADRLPMSPPISPESPALGPTAFKGGSVELGNDYGGGIGHDALGICVKASTSESCIAPSTAPEVHFPLGSVEPNLELGSVGVTKNSYTSGNHLVQGPKDLESKVEKVLSGEEEDTKMCQCRDSSFKGEILVLEQQLKERDEEIIAFKESLKNHEDKLQKFESSMEELAGLELPDAIKRLAEEMGMRKTAELALEKAVAQARNDLEAVLIEERTRDQVARQISHREYERSLAEERKQRMELRQKSKEDLDYVIQEEQKRRAELNWVYQQKIEKLQILRKSERSEYDTQLEKLRTEKEATEQKIKELSDELENRRMLGVTQRSGNEELVAMVKKINNRLAEEKNKNKRLESTMSQITEEAWVNVSQSKHEVQKLKNNIEDKDTQISNLEFELSVTKREKIEFEEAWRLVQKENDVLTQSPVGKDQPIEGLETDKRRSDDSGSGPSQISETRQQSNDIHEEILKKLSGESFISQSPIPGDQEEASTNPVALLEVVQNLKRDVKLYRSDIRAYKKDVKARDKTIQEQQARLIAKSKEIEKLHETLDSDLLRGFPQPPVSSLPPPVANTSSTSNSDATNLADSVITQIRDENEKLRKQLKACITNYRKAYDENQSLQDKHETVSGQQTILLTELENKVTKLRKEKELAENAAAKQIKQMQRSFLQLSNVVAAGVAVPAPQQLQERIKQNPMSPTNLTHPLTPRTSSITQATSSVLVPKPMVNRTGSRKMTIIVDNFELMQRPPSMAPTTPLPIPPPAQLSLQALPSPPPPPTPAKDCPINISVLNSNSTLNERKRSASDTELPKTNRNPVPPSNVKEEGESFVW